MAKNLGFSNTHEVQMAHFWHRIGSLQPIKRLHFIPLCTQSQSPSTLTLEMATHLPSKRPVCPSCSKPLRICLCTRMKTPIIDNSIAVTILQHKLEKKHPLNTARIATIGLKNLHVACVSDTKTEAQLHIRLMQTNSEPECDLLDFTVKKRSTISPWYSSRPDFDPKRHKFDQILASPGDVLSRGFVVRKFVKKQLNERSEDEESEEIEEFEVAVPSGSVLLYPNEESVGVEEIDLEVKNLIVLDGTWDKARRMYIENPWLKMLPHLKLDIGKVGLYGEVRKEPKAGYMSTIESIVYALEAFGEKSEGLSGLLDVFEAMVNDQRRCKNERLSKASFLSE